MNALRKLRRVSNAVFSLDGTNTKRTDLVRQDSDLLLSYYESSIPNENSHYIPSHSPAKLTAQHRTRKLSTDSSTSSSAYSHNEAEPQEQTDAGSESSAGVTKRLGAPSKGSADRRRLAIVQLDDSARKALHDLSAIGTIRERRGYKNDLAGLALVAPPDAAVHSYTHLTPPSTAPLPADNSNRGQKTAVQGGHHRAASDIATKTPYSRNLRNRRMADNDCDSNAASPSPAPPPPSDASQSVISTTAERGPVGQCSLSAQYGVYRDLNNPSPIRTPQIGEGKGIHVPVAAPVVVNLEQSAQPRLGNLPPLRSSSPTTSSVSHGNRESCQPASIYHVSGIFFIFDALTSSYCLV